VSVVCLSVSEPCVRVGLMCVHARDRPTKQKGFEELDKDHDGRVTRLEFTSGQKVIPV